MTPGSPIPVTREVVLVGGGHSHALVVRMLGMRPWPGIQVTLVSDVSHAPYSGMIPGHLAGFYSWEESHIDLRRLCTWAGVRFIGAQATGLDLQARRLAVAGRPSIAFDTASINIGSTPDFNGVSGAAEFAIPAKPVPRFLASWESLRTAATARTQRAVIVGAGAGGVEVALAMKARLGPRLEITLVHQGPAILPSHAPGVRKRLMAALRQPGLNVLTGVPVTAVHPDGVSMGDGRRLAADTVFWTTQASAPAWLGASGLEVDSAGFVVVDDTLRSVSHEAVFAAGDCATVRHAARPKSGVFAVRAARPLFANLERHLAGSPLRHWKPQSRFLGLVGTGTGRAVVSRGAWAAEGAWAWKWKDRIDRTFMRKFSVLPPMDSRRLRPARAPVSPGSPESQPKNSPRCLGCGGKVGASILHRVLARLRHTHPSVIAPPPDRTDIVAGLDSPDDAAVFRPPADAHLVQTIDHLSALVADPFVFGRIATLHALSDLFAMGATPHSALVTALIPFASEAISEELLTQLLTGVATELERAGTLLLGGHTAEAPATALTLACTGVAYPPSLWRKNGLRPGDALILTKPLGTGTLFAAAMHQAAQGRWIDAAINSMLASNQPAAHLAHTHGATAATDVTGFGLLGHLLEMLNASQVSAQLHLDALPILPGAIECAQQGYLSSLHPDNTRALASVTNPAPFLQHPHFPLLCDPQTSGGLLIAVPSAQANELIEAISHSSHKSASLLGAIQEATSSPAVTLL